VTARRATMDGRRPTADAGMYSICLSVGATDGGPEGDFDRPWVGGRDADIYTAPASSDFLLAFEVSARET
jgi:hypothetical protein